jgi:uncharacterized membrane protein YfcA
MRKLTVLLIACVLASSVSGCGGGGGSTPVTTTAVTGVETPAAISVVTAKE